MAGADFIFRMICNPSFAGYSPYFKRRENGEMLEKQRKFQCGNIETKNI